MHYNTLSQSPFLLYICSTIFQDINRKGITQALSHKSGDTDYHCCTAIPAPFLSIASTETIVHLDTWNHHYNITVLFHLQSEIFTQMCKAPQNEKYLIALSYPFLDTFLHHPRNLLLNDKLVRMFSYHSKKGSKNVNLA